MQNYVIYTSLTFVYRIQSRNKTFLSYSDSELYKQINIFYIYIKYLINFEKMGKCKKYTKITYEKRL